MNVCGERIRALRESMNYSQMKFAQIFDLGQSSVVRYEKGEASPPLELLVRIADYFDVSLDYIFGRTDNPQGKLYEYKPKNGYPADRPGVKFCVSVFRQKSRMALGSRADSGLNPLITESHGGQNGMRAGTA